MKPKITKDPGGKTATIRDGNGKFLGKVPLEVNNTSSNIAVAHDNAVRESFTNNSGNGTNSLNDVYNKVITHSTNSDKSQDEVNDNGIMMLREEVMSGEDLLTVEELEVLLSAKDLIKSKVENYHEKADWVTFQLAMRVLPPQSYGAQFEKRIRKAYGWSKNLAKDRAGDAHYELDGEVVNSEIKVSLITDSDKKANIVQIRKSHHMDYYDIFIIHQNGKVERFRLNKAQMDEEIFETGARLAHGTKGNNDGANENAEFRIDFNAVDTDPIYNRWKERYLLDGGEKELVEYAPADI